MRKATLTFALPQVRRVLARVLEATYTYHGSRETCVKVHTRAASANGAAAVAFVCPGDAGIHCTAMLAAETALTMLEAPSLPAGWMTPVVAVGDALAARLRKAGVVLSSRSC